MKKNTFLFALTLLLSLAHGPCLKAETKIYSSEDYKFTVETVFEGKDVIWGFDFLNQDEMIFSERSGVLRYLNLKTKTSAIISQVPKVYTEGQGGLLDVLVRPGTPTYVYITYSEKSPNNAVTSLGRAEWDKNDFKNFSRLFQTNAEGENAAHFGSRLVFDKDGFLFMSVGERMERNLAQKLEFDNGKILRLNADGTIPKNNPFVSNPKARPEIWTLGHRNPQGIAIHPTTEQLWNCEFGPQGGDEVNLVVPGKNYGWPVITYGREYEGPRIGTTHRAGMEQPIIYYVPSISPSGMNFYTGDRFPLWKNNLFLANLSSTHIRRLVIDGKKITKQESLLSELDERMRHVRTGPDGLLYVSTDSGKILRLVPVGK